ncbi:TonB family protein [Fluviicola sp.]|uniref:TonB family protein n=1 Tax=Fluviicola sp. TaxID=1917219 RepID=UPI002625F728|nr:TonB family protein [Fluviicola sp.]
MKLTAFTLMLFLSVFTFGQSAKKTNDRLRTELAKEQQKQDSVHQAFSLLNNQAEDLQHQFGKQKERFITESSNTLFYRDSISRVLYNLKRLEHYPDMTDVQKYMDMSNGWYFLQSVLEMKKKMEPMDHLSEALNENGLELKQQNERLKQKIVEYQNQAKLNDLRLQNNVTAIRQLKSAISLLDSASLVYENATGILLSKKRGLDSELESLRENYRLKGPGGFPDAYRVVFPDVHPAPKIEVTNEPYYRDEGLADVPLPVVESSRIVAKEPEIYSVVDEIAEFPGGTAMLKKYLADNLRYPPAAKELGISGKAYVKFVVSKEGEILNVQIIKGVPDCNECNTEAIRLVKKMPKWKPGKFQGKPVDSYFNLPVEFKLN